MVSKHGANVHQVESYEKYIKYLFGNFLVLTLVEFGYKIVHNSTNSNAPMTKKIVIFVARQ